MQFMTNQLNQLKNESNVSLKDMDKHEEAIATLKHVFASILMFLSL